MKFDALLANSAKLDTAGAAVVGGVGVYEDRFRFLKASDFREEKFFLEPARSTNDRSQARFGDEEFGFGEVKARSM